MTEASTRRPIGAHLVGSIPADSAEVAFRLAADNLGDHLKRLPDGEVGERDGWIRWQYFKIAASPALKQSEKKNVYVPVPPLELTDGVTSADELQLDNLGYADAAIDSWKTFERLLTDGSIRSDVRFQVGLPTPLSVALIYVEKDSRAVFEEAYERSLLNELTRIFDAIPLEQLAIQWETVIEFALLEGLVEDHIGGNILDNVTTRVARLIDRIPVAAQTGLHLCYGDSGHKHFCEPKDAGFLAAVSEGVVRKAGRAINWIHMPVPKERDDDAYFEPLRDLAVPDSTELYLGLVHHTGGIEGTRQRIGAALAAAPAFGVATECGLGRRDPQTITELLKQHAAVTASYSD